MIGVSVLIVICGSDSRKSEPSNVCSVVVRRIVGPGQVLPCLTASAPAGFSTVSCFNFKLVLSTANTEQDSTAKSFW